MLEKILSNIEGAVSLEECLLLYELASEVESGCIIEIGSYRGRSTVALALGTLAQHNVPLYCIEPHEEFTGVLGGRFGPHDRSEFFKNILAAGVSETVRLVNLSSEIVRPGWHLPIGMLWIDGDHRYEAVARDFSCWEPFVSIGGPIVMHDSLDPALGPSKVIDEALNTGRFSLESRLELTTVLRKKAT